MSNFWDRNQDQIHEDVASDRDFTAVEPIHATKRLKEAKAINIDHIEADPQHREQFDQDSLERLSKSILDEGQLQPIRVRFDANRNGGRYVIIAGERRFRACQMAGLQTVDCIVAEGELSDATILRQQVIENALREDLLPSEAGKAYAAAMELEGLNGKELAEKLHISPSTVSRTVGLLSLPQEVQDRVDAGDLAITKALKMNDAAEAPATKAKKRPSKETKIKTSVGITVSFKARKLLKPEEMQQAIAEVMAGLQEAA